MLRIGLAQAEEQGQIIRGEKQTTKAFYKHSESNEIFVIEHRWDGVLIGSCGPLSGPLKNRDDYEITNKNNLYTDEENQSSQ
jgi:hypothetical protein